MSELDYYSLLEVDADASRAQLQTSFRRLAKQWHPDQSDAPDARARFVEIATAYQILGDEEKRSVYDRLRMKTASQVDSSTGEEEFVAKWRDEAEQRSAQWSRERFEKFSSLFMRVDKVLHRTAYQAGQLLKGSLWGSEQIKKIAKRVGYCYALLGIWLALVGAPLFFFLFYYIGRRSPGRIEFLNALLRVMQLLFVLVWLILIDVLHPVVHLFFWLDQLLLVLLSWQISRQLAEN